MSDSKLDYLVSKVEFLKEKEISFGIERKDDSYYLKIVNHTELNTREEAYEVVDAIQSLFKAL